jgi:hypothetical protein
MYQPTLHRVFNNSLRYRVSVAFFYEVYINASIDKNNVFRAEKEHFCSAVYNQLIVSFFLGTNGIRIQSNFDAAVEPAELCREKTGGVAKYEKVVYGEHLVKKVLNNFVL